MSSYSALSILYNFSGLFLSIKEVSVGFLSFHIPNESFPGMIIATEFCSCILALPHALGKLLRRCSYPVLYCFSIFYKECFLPVYIIHSSNISFSLTPLKAPLWPDSMCPFQVCPKEEHTYSSLPLCVPA